MKYKSIEQITTEYNIDFTTIVELKKNLKSRLAKYHPDNNGGNFKNSKDKTMYESLNSAYEFVSNQSTEIVSRDEITALTKAIEDLTIDKNESKSEMVLLEKINNSIKNYSSVHLFPKISTTAVTSVISFLWLFPKIISEHEVLSNLINTASIEFTYFWLASVTMTGSIWTLLKFLERKDAAIKRTLNLESTQNRIFNSFISYKLYDKKNVERGYIQFRKEDFIDFIMGFDLRRGEYEYARKRETNPISLFLSRKNIDIELYQSLSDLIINKSVSKGLVSVDSTKSLSDLYTLKVDKESINHYSQYYV